jgi:tetratricopeptide (TPR) repeat protein
MLLKLLKNLLRAKPGRDDAAAAGAAPWPLLERVIGAYNRRDYEEALRLCRQTLAAAPDHAQAHHVSARALIELRRPAEAEPHLHAALAADPGLAEAHADLCRLLRGAGDAEGAERHGRLAVELAPAEPRHRLALADVLDDAARHAESLEQISLAQEYAPERVDILERLILKLDHVGQYEAALRIAERAMRELGPRFETHHFLGYARFSTGDHEGAVEACRAAIRLNSRSPGIFVTLGSALLALGRADEAMAAYRRALKVLPDYPDALFHLGMLNLMRGRYRDGWAGFEYRFKIPRGTRRPCEPRWNGTSLRGRALHVLREQGLGDDIMYASCYPQLIADARHCVIECEPRLEKLFRRSFPQAEFVPIVDNATKAEVLERDDVDVRIFSASVPGYLRNSLRDFPAHQGYLLPDSERVRHWRERLETLGPGLKIGLSWRGGTVYTHRLRRTLALDTLAPLLATSGVCWVNLQYGDRRQELEALRERQGIAVADWPEAIDGDYDETAALVGALDLVISVCTSVIHLTGALGRRAWVMVPFAPEWRYGLEGETMPWYPGVRLYRQSDPQDWGKVIERLRRDLAGLLSNPGSPAVAGALSGKREVQG